MGCCGENEVEPGAKKSFDPSFKGPIKNRSCTDVICCLLFFVFILGYIVIGIFAWLNGDPIILLNPTDNQGRICGVNYGDLDLRNKNYLYYFDFTQCASPAVTITLQCPTTQICVSACPSTYWTYFPDIAVAEAQLLANGGNRESAANAIVWKNYICTYGFNARTEFINGMDIQTMISAGRCAPYYLPLTPVASRCIPAILSNLTEIAIPNDPSNVLVDANNQTITGAALEAGLDVVGLYLDARQIADKIFADLTASWFWLLVAFGIAAFVAFFWIVLMRWIAGIVIWIILIGLVGVIAFGIWYCYDEYNRLKTVAGSDSSILAVGFTTSLDTYLALQDTWLAFRLLSRRNWNEESRCLTKIISIVIVIKTALLVIILAVTEAILLLLILFLRKRILIAIQVIKEASKAVGQMISTLFFPLVTFFLVIIAVSFWIATALFLASSGNPVYEVVDTRNLTATGETSLTGQACNITEWNNETHPFYLNDSIKCVFEKYGGDSIFQQNVIWLQVIAAFGMLWIVNWILALGLMTMSGAFASYYWAWEKPKDIPLLPVYSSFGRALRYHTGSLAFGALLITIVQMIRIILEYIDHKVKGSENKLAKVIICCCKCCFWCLEKFLKFMNRNAYIMIALYGKNFCWSAKEALSLLLRNFLRAAVLDKVTDFLLFIGKLFVAVGMGSLSWAFFTNKIETFNYVTAPALNYYWMIVIIIGVSSYFIAAAFFNTYSIAVDTIFLCFLEDLERNDGSPEKPYYMSKGLRKVMNKRNKKDKSKKDQ